MKKYSLIKTLKNSVLILGLMSVMILAGCQKDKGKEEIPDQPRIIAEFANGAIRVIENPAVKIHNENSYPGTADVNAKHDALSISRFSDEDGEDCDDCVKLPLTPDYRFTIVGRFDTWEVEGWDGKKYTVQASHLKMVRDNHVIVGYNYKAPEGGQAMNLGGYVLYSYVVGGTVEDPVVTFTTKYGVVIRNSQINALDFDDNTRRLYLAGANEEEELGYINDPAHGANKNTASVLVFDLNASMMLTTEPVFFAALQSSQATSIKKHGDAFYVTTGADGGLYRFADAQLSSKPKLEIVGGVKQWGKFVEELRPWLAERFVREIKDARSVVTDGANLYVFQADPVQVSKLTMAGAPVGTALAFTDKDKIGGDLQKEAKSEMFAWDKHLFVPLNNLGMRTITTANMTELAVGKFDAPNTFCFDYNHAAAIAEARAEWDAGLADLQAGTVGSGDDDMFETLADKNEAIAEYQAEPFDPDDVPNPCEDWKAADWNKEDDVTNSISMNTDAVIPNRTDLLFVANGAQGLSFYSVVEGELKGVKETHIIEHTTLTFSGINAGSTNYVDTRGNLAMVANGNGGVIALHIGVAPPPTIPTVPGEICGYTEWNNYIYKGPNALFVDGRRVFATNANRNSHPYDVLVSLFGRTGSQRATAKKRALRYIEVTEANTELFVTYLHESTNFKNTLGFLVIPSTGASITGASGTNSMTNVRKRASGSDEWQWFKREIKHPILYGRDAAWRNKPYFEADEKIYRNGRLAGGILMPYVRDESRGGNLVEGKTTVQIGGAGHKFNRGDRVVLFVAPNSWDPQTGRMNITARRSLPTRIFFMHDVFNRRSAVPHASIFGRFRDQMMNSFLLINNTNANTSSNIGSQVNDNHATAMIVVIEDRHKKPSDVTYNKMIVAITDNIDPCDGTRKRITKFATPYWSVNYMRKDITSTPASIRINGQ